MREVREVIRIFGEYSTWVSSLKQLDEKLWTAPISEGKWSVSEIVAHLMNWDKYLISDILPAVRQGEGMNFPDFDSYNQLASEYARSGIPQPAIINEAKAARELLVEQLFEMPVEQLCQPLPANGVSHCPHTATPYSLSYIIKEFIEHDNYHKGQIVHFISSAITE